MADAGDENHLKSLQQSKRRKKSCVCIGQTKVGNFWDDNHE